MKDLTPKLSKFENKGVHMSRYKASFLHLLISLGIGLTTLVVMISIWYPGALLKAAGGDGLILILLGVDVTIGPLITLIIFDTKKKHLKYDLMVVAVLQLSALTYGVSVVYQARPIYLIFVVDRFELVRASDIDPDDMKEVTTSEFKSLPTGRPRIIGVNPPANSDEKLKAIDLALAGKDVHLIPKHYTAYGPSQQEQVKKRAQTIQRLKEINPQLQNEIDHSVAQLGKKEDEIGYLPLKANARDMSVIVDRNTGEILDYWMFLPWKA